jgi:hypothetical protein
MPKKKEMTVEEAYNARHGKKKKKNEGVVGAFIGAIEKKEAGMKAAEDKPKKVRKVVDKVKPAPVVAVAPPPKTYKGDEARYRALIRKGAKKTPAERAEYKKLKAKLKK